MPRLADAKAALIAEALADLYDLRAAAAPSLHQLADALRPPMLAPVLYRPPVLVDDHHPEEPCRN